MKNFVSGISRVVTTILVAGLFCLASLNIASAQQCNVQSSSAAVSNSQAQALQNLSVLQALQAQAVVQPRAVTSASAVAGSGPSVAALRAAASPVYLGVPVSVPIAVPTATATSTATNGLAVPPPVAVDPILVTALQNSGGGGSSRSVSVSRVGSRLHLPRPRANVSRSVAVSRTR